MRKDITMIKLYRLVGETILEIWTKDDVRIYNRLSIRQTNALGDAVSLAILKSDGTLRPFRIGLGWVWEAKWYLSPIDNSGEL